jgi:uncharacterized membrane protein (UPF0127 family)
MRRSVLAVAFCVLAGSCRNGQSDAATAAAATNSATKASPVGASAAALVVLHAGGRDVPIRVELARTEPQRERGLMFRNHLDPGDGMLFLFPRPAGLTFWMKNTFIPLDMLFIDHDRHVVGIVEEAVPETETPRGVPHDSQFVLEIVGGLARRLGVAVGSTVEFRNVHEDDIAN